MRHSVLLLPLCGLLTFAVSPAFGAQTVVSLTFDDGSADQVLAGQMLDQRGMKGTFYINSIRLGESSWYMTRANVDTLKANGHEIAGHSLDHLDLIQQTQQEATRQICDDRQLLQDWGYSPVSFAYPFGSFNASVEAIAQGCGYSSARIVGGVGCPGCPKTEAIPPPDRFAISSPNSIVSGDTLATIQKYVTDAESAGGGWMPLVFHHVCVTGAAACDGYSVTQANLSAFLDWLQARAAQGTVVQTVAQVMGAAPPPPPAPPAISLLSPSSATAGSPGFTLTVFGSGFLSGATVHWDGSSRSSVFVSNTQLTASLLASDLAVPKTANVTVLNPGPGGETSLPRSFFVAAPASTGPVNQAQFTEGFDYPNGLVTNEYAYYNPADPTSVVSSTWEMTSGSLFADAGVGWTGVPDSVNPNAQSSNGTDSVGFRLVTKRKDFGDVSLYLTLNQVGFGTVSPEAWDNINVLLRYQSAQQLYYFTVSRRDNKVILIKVLPGGGGTLASVTRTALFGQNQSLRADVQNQPNGSVVLKLTMNGTQVLSFTDSGTGGAPILAPGGVGLWGNNANFKFDDVTALPFGVAPSTVPAPNPPPTLASLSASSATAGSPAFALSLFGSQFISSSTVRWNGSARGTVFISSTQLRASILASDLAAPTTANLTVFNPGPGGGTSTATPFFVIAPVIPNPSPTLASLSASSATAGAPGFALSLFGAGFISSSTARWNGSARTTVFVSSTQLTASILASDLSTPTTANLTVFNPGPGGGISTATAFFVIAPAPIPNPSPTLASLSASSATAGAPGFALSLFGAGFISSSTARWNGSDRNTVFVSSVELTAAILASDLAAPATANLTVFNPGPGGGISTATSFFVIAPPSTGTANPLPILASLSPSSATAGAPGFALSLFGTGFISSSTARWNGSARTTVFVSSTQLTAAILVSDLASPTTANLTVFNPGPGGGISTATPFFVIAPVSTATANPLPTLASLSPSSATAGAPGFSLSLFGAGFISSSTARWNGSARTTVFISSTQLTATILASDLASPTTANLTVFNLGPGGGISSPAAFFVTAPISSAPPTVALFSEAFNYPNGLVTNEYAYYNPADPTSVVSSTWEMTSGSLFADAGVGWTGVPDSVNPNAQSSNGTDSVGFRLVTKRKDFGDVSLYLTLNQVGFGTVSPAAWDNINVLLRYQSAQSLYYFTVSRRDNKVILIKVLPGGGGTLVSATRTALFGQNQTLRADVQNQPNGSVLLKLTMNGVQVLSFTDSGTGGAPIVAPGAVGVWGNNANFKFDDFTALPFGAAPSTAPPPNPSPTLASLSASSATAGAPGFALSLFGAGFISSSTARWNGSARTTVFVSSAQLTASILASDLAAPTTANLTVFSPGPGGGTSIATPFFVVAAVSTETANPSPTLTSLSPSTATAGAPGFALSLFGTGFFSSSTARWNGSARTTVFVSTTQLMASILASDLAAPTTANLTVFNPGPGGGTSTSAPFFVVAPVSTGTPGGFTDAFNVPDGLISNRNAASPRSAKWLVTGGSLFASGGQGWTGTPDAVSPNATSSNGTGSAVFRVLTASSSLGSEVTVRVSVLNFVSAQAIGNWDGAHVYLRYLDASNYYALSVYRRDGRAAIKKRRNGTETTLTTPVYAAAPLGTAQAVRALAVTNANGSVTLQLYVNGVLVASGVDATAPLTGLGKVGMAGENTNFKFDDFTVVPPAGGGAGVASFSGSPPSPTPVPAAADPAFGSKAFYAFPNPVRGVKSATFRFQPGVADIVEVRVYDLTGRKVHESSAFTDRGAFDDGNGLGPQFTYDHVWDVSGIGSGVYTYVLAARKAGQPDALKAGKLAIIK